MSHSLFLQSDEAWAQSSITCRKTSQERARSMIAGRSPGAIKFSHAAAYGCFLPINYRLRVAEIAYKVEHSEAPMPGCDREPAGSGHMASAELVVPPRNVNAEFELTRHCPDRSGRAAPAGK